jgi:hypothetical protein
MIATMAAAAPTSGQTGRTGGCAGAAAGWAGTSVDGPVLGPPDDPGDTAGAGPVGPPWPAGASVGEPPVAPWATPGIPGATLPGPGRAGGALAGALVGGIGVGALVGLGLDGSGVGGQVGLAPVPGQCVGCGAEPAAAGVASVTDMASRTTARPKGVRHTSARSIGPL